MLCPTHQSESVRRSFRGSRERGQNLVEFALVLPVIMLLMIGGYNLGVLFLRVTDAGFIAQSAAVSAARYGGYTAVLQQSVDQQITSSFLGGDRQHFSWHLETRGAGGDTVCGGSTPCTCNWGEQVAAVTTYQWEFNAVLYTWHGTYQTEKTALCWRGTVPGAPAADTDAGGW